MLKGNFEIRARRQFSRLIFDEFNIVKNVTNEVTARLHPAVIPLVDCEKIAGKILGKNATPIFSNGSFLNLWIAEIEKEVFSFQTFEQTRACSFRMENGFFD